MHHLGITGVTAIGDRIRIVRGGMSQRAFAASLGLTQPTIQRYERNERAPDADVLRLICEKYDVDPAWLLTGDGLEPLNAETSADQRVQAGLRSVVRSRPRSTRVDSDVVLIPVRNMEPSAGTGLDAAGAEWVEETIPISQEEFAELEVPHASLEAVPIIGDSMSPTLNSGDKVLVDTRTSEPDRIKEGLYVLQVDQQLFVKRLCPLGDRRFEMVSDNPSYKSKVIGPDTPSFRIVGRVVGERKRTP